MPRTPIRIHLTEECWAFMLAIKSPAMTAEVHALLERAPGMLVAQPSPHRHYILHLLRLDAWHLLEHVGALHDILPREDKQRPLYERCIAAIEASIGRSPAASVCRQRRA
jgi:hypothetical protein